ncbi:MAG: carboxylating nicotinate-nucleotide diphosphorylase [Cyanobacteria bacterium J06632_22]
MLPPEVVTEPWIKQWLREDIGRGDWAVQGLGARSQQFGSGYWVAKAPGIICGLPIAQQVFSILDTQVSFNPQVRDGMQVEPGQTIATLTGPLGSLLTGERVALNLAMRLSGIASATRQYVEAIEAYAAQFVDTRKTTPGLRLLEKYATYIGGAQNHRMGLDDGVMIKDNHIAAVGGIEIAVQQVRQRIPYPLTIEVETEGLAQVKTAVDAGADIIMLDNMTTDQMQQAVALIRSSGKRIKIEASGNVSLDTIAAVAATGVDYISSSGPITRSHWLDLSMRVKMHPSP